MDVESYATLAAFSLIESGLPNDGKDQLICYVDLGANVTAITVLRNDQSVYTREQAFGGAQLTMDIQRAYGMSPEEAEGAKRNGGLPDNYDNEVLRPFIDNCALEVSRGLQFFFTSTQYNQVDHIVLAGGCAVIPGLEDAIASRTQVNTVIANPFANMTLSSRVRPKLLAADAPSLMIACGLAMRRFDS